MIQHRFGLGFVKAYRPSKQLFSHVGTEPSLPGYYQYFSGNKCVFAQGHNKFNKVKSKIKSHIINRDGLVDQYEYVKWSTRIS